jgi:hypothetical protein
MIYALKIAGGVVVLYGISLFLPTAGEVTPGFDAAIAYFIGIVRSLVDLLPFMEVPFELVMIALFIHFTLFVWQWLVRIWGLILG